MDLIERLRVIGQWLDHRAHFEPEPETKASHSEDADTCREAAAALEAARKDACVALVADIRFACGDNGKRMQPELVEFIRELAADAGRYRWLRDPCSGAERHIYYSRGDYGKGLMSGSMLDEVIDAAMEAQRLAREEA